MIFKKIKSNPALCSYAKKALIALGLVIGFLYASFLFIIPNVININNFTPQISKQIEDITGFKLELINPKLKTTWKLSIKVSAQKISLKYSDGSDFASLKEPSVELNLPTLILKHLNLDKIYAKEASLALVFTKDKKYTLEEYILNSIKNTKTEEKQQNASLPLELRNINIEVQNTLFTLDDKNTSKKYLLKANDTNISLATLKGPLKIKTTGYLKREGLDENFVDFNINFQTKIPQIASQDDKKSNNLEDFKINFNPLDSLDLFSLRSKLDVDLKITDPSENFSAKGYVNLDKISLKVKGVQLPEGYIKTNFDKNKVTTNSKIYISKDEFLSANNSMTTGKKSNILLNIKTEKLNLSNIKSLTESILDMLNIKNSLNLISASGVIKCDFKLDSNFKTVKSSGMLELNDGTIKYPSANITLDKISSNLDFSENKISIKDTGAYLNGSKFSVLGTIDTNTNLDIKVKSDPLKITDIIKLATGLSVIKEKDIQDYKFNAGEVLISLDATGNFKNIIPLANIELKKLSLFIKSLSMPITLDNIKITAQPDKKDKNNFLAQIVAQNFKANLKNPTFNINAPKCTINTDSKALEISPFDLILHGSKISVAGTVKDYMSEPDIAITANGKINPDTILTFVPQANRKYISRAGQMPINASIKGNIDNLKLSANITSNPQNYISVVEIKNIKGLQNTLNADLNIKNDTLFINTCAINSKNKNIVSVNGKINNIYGKNPTLAPVNIVTGEKLSLNVAALGKLSLDANANLALTSSLYNPQIAGSADLSNINYQELKTTVANAYLEFKKSIINARADGIKIAGSDFSGNAELLADISKNITINSLNFNSAYIDSDALLKIVSSMPNTQTTAGPSVPMSIKKGMGKIAKLKSGAMIAENISFDFNMYNNLVKLTNLQATFADGKITGTCDYNIANTKVNVDGTGKGINARKAVSMIAGASSILTNGTVNGIAKLSTRGNTYEQQMRSLNGQVIFDVSNGQYGEAARFERFLHAGNLLTQSLLNLNLNQTISAVTGRNTGEFKKINGKISLANGWANITSLESSGPNMSLFITGKYNILTGNSNLKILGRISSNIVSVLGPLGSFSLDKVVNKLPQTGAAILNTIMSIAPQNPLYAEINSSDLAKIPSLSTVTSNAESKDFQVLINGPISKTTSIKSFKWANKESTTTGN